jgi:hypothetical protein
VASRHFYRQHLVTYLMAVAVVDQFEVVEFQRQQRPLTDVLNSLNRSLGFADAYPFTLAPKLIDMPRFGHKMIASARSSSERMPKQIREPTADSTADADAKPVPLSLQMAKRRTPRPGAPVGTAVA